MHEECVGEMEEGRDMSTVPCTPSRWQEPGVYPSCCQALDNQINHKWEEEGVHAPPGNSKLG